MSHEKLYCCCCGKQALKNENPPQDDKYKTKLEGGRAGFKSNEVFCGYCSLDMDENGLFPEEAAQVKDY